MNRPSGHSRVWRRSTAEALLITGLTAFVLVGCAEVREPAEPTSVHPASWNIPGSDDFHGARVAARGPESCQGCHDGDFSGEPGVPGCSDCHVGPGGHPAGWVSETSPAFHGNEVARAGNAACKTCHGQDYLGGWSGVSCAECHAGGPSGHPDGWLDEASLSFHGLRVLAEGYESCTRCHGPGLAGGTSGVACGECHE